MVLALIQCNQQYVTFCGSCAQLVHGSCFVLPIDRSLDQHFPASRIVREIRGVGPLRDETAWHHCAMVPLNSTRMAVVSPCGANAVSALIAQGNADALTTFGSVGSRTALFKRHAH
jgi:hypothetical protein